jgi:hypothetical protein
MNRIVMAVALAAALSAPSSALGAVRRTFVASAGSDTWPCTRTLPCR